MVRNGNAEDPKTPGVEERILTKVYQTLDRLWQPVDPRPLGCNRSSEIFLPERLTLCLVLGIESTQFGLSRDLNAII